MGCRAVPRGWGKGWRGWGPGWGRGWAWPGRGWGWRWLLAAEEGSAAVPPGPPPWAGWRLRLAMGGAGAEEVLEERLRWLERLRDAIEEEIKLTREELRRLRRGREED